MHCPLAATSKRINTSIIRLFEHQTLDDDGPSINRCLRAGVLQPLRSSSYVQSNTNDETDFRQPPQAKETHDGWQLPLDGSAQ